MSERQLSQRDDYGWGMPVATRWADNDIYGHVNNVAYYGYFDTIANAFMIKEGGLDIHEGTHIGVIVESGCRYHQSAAYPEILEGRLRVGNLGRSSVRWELAIFKEGVDTAIAEGHFVHVFVTRDDMRPTPIPDPLRAAMQTISADGG